MIFYIVSQLKVQRNQLIVKKKKLEGNEKRNENRKKVIKKPTDKLNCYQFNFLPY